MVNVQNGCNQPDLKLFNSWIQMKKRLLEKESNVTSDMTRSTVPHRFANFRY